MKLVIPCLLTLVCALPVEVRSADAPAEEPARKWLETARRHTSRISDRADRVEIYSLLAVTAVDVGDRPMQEDLIRRVERTLQGLDEWEIDSARISLGTSFAVAGNTDRMNELFDAVECESCRAAALAGAAHALAVRGRQEAYAPLIVRALEMIPEAHPDEKDEITFNAVLALAWAGDFQTAKDLSLLVTSEWTRVELLAMVAGVQAEKGDRDAGRETLKGALERLSQVKEDVEDPFQLDRDAALSAIVTAEAALGELDSAKERVEQVRDSSYRSLALAAMAWGHERSGGRDRAAELIAEAANVAMIEPVDFIRAWDLYDVGYYRGAAGLGEGVEEWVEELASPLERALASTGLAAGFAERSRGK